MQAGSDIPIEIIMVCVCAFLAIIIVIVGLYRHFSFKKSSSTLNKRVEFWLSEKGSFKEDVQAKAQKEKEEKEKNFIDRVVVPLGENVGSWVSEKGDDYTAESNKRMQLIKAGIRGKNSVQMFAGIRFAAAIALFVLFLLIFSVVVDPSSGFMFGLIAAGLGYMLPNFVLDSMAGGRRVNVDKVLPDAIDLLVICTQAGMNIDQALLKSALNLGPNGKDLADEIILTNREMHLGQDRKLCWKNLGERTLSEELKNLAGIISQAEQRGGSLADILKEQAEFMRVRKMQSAEEKAAQLTVKMMIPLALFIFPVIMCVTIGPPIVKLLIQFGIAK